ncbi:hypothetical protein Hypma_003469 [Hypsizygus marmoreus]|uniref:Uncharacterized protein n=1 Tax=Hypsizygus marmoreus TaxID=39966 RepID=A0A369J224_HYPMA|nr:hypothetical protein Hypma_003469 [Hypsizygus marmoreus]
MFLSAFRGIPKGSFILHMNRLLGSFFATRDVETFKNLQESLGIIIGRSFALQFFDRMVYVGSGLDLYLEVCNSSQLGVWLKNIGYAFVPKPHQQPTFLKSWSEALEETSGNISMLLTSWGFSYIFHFKNWTTNSSILLTTSVTCPLSQILSSHSSATFILLLHL